MEKLTLTERIARWLSNRWNSLVCLVHGHQDFGVACGVECLRCGRESALDLRDLAPPRLTYAGDPERHRMRLQAAAPSKPDELSGDGYARLTVGDCYELENGRWKLTERGVRRMQAIGWIGPGDISAKTGDVLKVNVMTAEQARRNEDLVREMARAEVERAWLRGVRTKGVH